MGKVLGYIIGAYLLFGVLPAVLLAGPSFLFLLILVAVIVFLHRNGFFDRFRPGSGGVRELRIGPRLMIGSPVAALEDAAGVGARERTRRLEEAASTMGEQFPEDPVENPFLVDVLGALVHEPPEERMRVEEEYRAYRERFLTWQAKVMRLAHDARAAGQLREYDELEAELEGIESYLADLRQRAGEADVLEEKALDDTTRAGEVVAEARAAWEKLSEPRPAVLGEQLAAAERKHREAWDALDKGRERPSTARRLAAEAAELAEAVKGGAARIADLPAQVERRRSELEASIERVERDLERVRDKLASAAESYAPSCWHEIRGVGHAARRAAERARRLGESAARMSASIGPAGLEETALELDRAEAARAEASRLAGTIENHLVRLEEAALGGRERIVAAEKEADRAWAFLHELSGADAALKRGEELLGRASELTARANEELGKAQPDWLAITDLADRSLELARLAQSERLWERDGSEDLRHALEDVKARAEKAREMANGLTLVFPDVAERLRPLLDAADAAYKRALRSEASLTTSNGEPAKPESAIEAFEEAERAATRFCNRAEGRGEPDRTNGPTSAGARFVFSLVWKSSAEPER